MASYHLKILYKRMTLKITTVIVREVHKFPVKNSYGYTSSECNQTIPTQVVSSLSLMDGVDLIDDFSNISNNDDGIINLWTTGNGPYCGQ